MTQPIERNQTRPNADFDTAQKAIGFDASKYAHLLDDDNLSEAERQELLQALWNIISQFVQLGFGVHPLQQAQQNSDNCEQVTTEQRLIATSLLHSQKEQSGGQS
jgi:hypothetical protein